MCTDWKQKGFLAVKINPSFIVVEAAKIGDVKAEIVFQDNSYEIDRLTIF